MLQSLAFSSEDICLLAAAFNTTIESISVEIRCSESQCANGIECKVPTELR